MLTSSLAKLCWYLTKLWTFRCYFRSLGLLQNANPVIYWFAYETKDWWDCMSKSFSWPLSNRMEWIVFWMEFACSNPKMPWVSGSSETRKHNHTTHQWCKFYFRSQRIEFRIKSLYSANSFGITKEIQRTIAHERHKKCAYFSFRTVFFAWICFLHFMFWFLLALSLVFIWSPRLPLCNRRKHE